MGTGKHRPTLMQIQFKLPTKIISSILIMFILIMVVYCFNVPNPNMILIAEVFGKDHSYRYGGDEFLVIYPDALEEEFDEKMKISLTL